MNLKEKIIESSYNKLWWARTPLMVFYFFLLYKHSQNPLYSSIMDPFNLGIHELGHFVFGIFGEFVGLAGGTLLQLLIPTISIIMFLKQKDYFGISFSFAWLADNLYDVSQYARDAFLMELPLVSPIPGATVCHDWNTMLTRLNLLKHYNLIADGFRISGTLFLIAAIVWGGYVLWYMRVAKGSRVVDPELVEKLTKDLK